jgi:hypothetical protein
VLNLNDADFLTDYPVDNLLLIAENLPAGIHVIELNNLDTTTGNHCGFYYLSIKKTKYRKNTVIASDSSVVTYKKPVKTLNDLEFTTTNASAENVIVTDVITSRIMRNIDVEVTATLNNNEGFFVMGGSRGGVDGSTKVPRGGVILYVALNNLMITEGAVGGYLTSTAVTSATSYIGSQHIYRLQVSTAGVCTILVDGTQVGTYTMQKNVYGGYFGFWKKTSGLLKIPKVVFRE